MDSVEELEVVDRAGFMAGSAVATLLSAFGAEVIKVESQDHVVRVPASQGPFRTYGASFVKDI